MTALLVALGAAIGTPLRYLADRAIQARHDSAFPWGTFAVNVGGSGLLGFLTALPAHDGLMAAVGTGLCGTLTTYSTFGYETLRLAEGGARTLAVLNAAASIAGALGAAYLGFAAGQALGPGHGHGLPPAPP